MSIDPDAQPNGHRRWLASMQEMRAEVSFQLVQGERFDAVVNAVYDECAIVEPTSLGHWGDQYSQRLLFYHAIVTMDAKRL